MVLQAIARLGSATASASRRSAVTGVRSRWERSATARRSSVKSSVVRSARPLSARASSSVSSVPRTSARAERSPSRSWWATPATPSSGWLMRRPSHEAMAGPSASSSTPRPMRPSHASVTPRRRSSGATLVRTTAVPSPVTTGSSTRPPASSTTVNASPSRACRTSGSLARHPADPEDGAGLGEHGGAGDAARVDPVDDLGELALVADPGDQDRDAAGLLVGGRHRPVLGERAHQQAERHDEGHHHGRGRGDDQPGDATAHRRLPPSAGVDEAYADPADAVQVARLGRGLAELATQPRQVHVDGPLGAAVRRRQTSASSSRLVTTSPGRAGQREQQVELLAAPAPLARPSRLTVRARSSMTSSPTRTGSAGAPARRPHVAAPPGSGRRAGRSPNGLTT